MASATLLSTALIAGMIAAFNPCGFAMLPAYLAFFVGNQSDDTTANRAKSIFKALIVGLTMSVSFVTLFGVIGVIASTIVSESAIKQQLQWATFILGILMIPMGIWLLFGKEIKVRIPRLQKGGDSGNLGSIFLFGISFGIVSLGCTIGPFFATVIGTFSSDSWFEGVQVFITYGLGMSLIVMFLTLATGMARSEVALLMRRVLPHIGKISGVFLILTGVFLTIYGWWEIQIFRGNVSSNWLTDTSAEFQSSITNWINEIGASHISIVLGILIGGAIVWASTSLQNIDDEQEKRQLLIWRYSLLGALTVLWLVLEIVRYDWELLVLPIYRTVIDLPSRVWGWATDPVRWSVPFEILFTAFIIMIVVLRIRKNQEAKMSGGSDSEISEVEIKETEIRETVEATK